MEEEKEQAADGGVKVSKTSRWEVRKFPKGFAVVLFETEDGKDPVAVKSTGVLHPDIVGSDIADVVRVCTRFGFSVAQLVDDCRMSDSRRLAEAECERLSKELSEGVDK